MEDHEVVDEGPVVRGRAAEQPRVGREVGRVGPGTLEEDAAPALDEPSRPEEDRVRINDEVELTAHVTPRLPLEDLLDDPARAVDPAGAHCGPLAQPGLGEGARLVDPLDPETGDLAHDRALEQPRDQDHPARRRPHPGADTAHAKRERPLVFRMERNEGWKVAAQGFSDSSGATRESRSAAWYSLNSRPTSSDASADIIHLLADRLLSCGSGL